MARECKCHAHFTSTAARDIDWYFIKGIKEQSLINKQGRTLNLSWSDIKVGTKNQHGCFEIIQCFGLWYTYFCRLSIGCTETWFELLRVKLYRNDLKGNRNNFYM